MNEICNQSIAADLLFGSEIDVVMEQLNEAGDYNFMVRAVEQFLLTKAKVIKDCLPIDQVLISLLHHRNAMNIDTLAKDACVSIRQLERQGKNESVYHRKHLQDWCGFQKHGQ